MREAIAEVRGRDEQQVAVHSVPFRVSVSWLEEILDYGFELKERVNTPDELIELLRDEAGLVITRERRETSTLSVRQRNAAHESA